MELREIEIRFALKPPHPAAFGVLGIKVHRHPVADLITESAPFEWRMSSCSCPHYTRYIYTYKRTPEGKRLPLRVLSDSGLRLGRNGILNTPVQVILAHLSFVQLACPAMPTCERRQLDQSSAPGGSLAIVAWDCVVRYGREVKFRGGSKMLRGLG